MIQENRINQLIEKLNAYEGPLSIKLTIGNRKYDVFVSKEENNQKSLKKQLEKVFKHIDVDEAVDVIVCVFEYDPKGSMSFNFTI
jgi:ABC-type arginine transport system ATPase subunit